jgi:signal transduction histidine kinase
LIGLLAPLFARRGRSGRHATGSAANVPTEPSLKIDLGDLAVAQMVHDVRNQLAVVILSAERLSQLVREGEAGREIAELRHCALRASVLTRELLMAGRRVPRHRVDLNHAVAQAAVAITPVTGERIHLRLRLAPEPVTVVADAAELERILLNLALNAWDAMEAGGELTIETVAVGAPSTGSTGCARPGPCARLTVSDTGCGMAPEVRERVFEPFFTTRAKGTGLGLTSVAFTVQQLGGTISVESEPGRGTAVIISLPTVQ